MRWCLVHCVPSSRLVTKVLRVTRAVTYDARRALGVMSDESVARDARGHIRRAVQYSQYSKYNIYSKYSQ